MIGLPAEARISGDAAPRVSQEGVRHAARGGKTDKYKMITRIVILMMMIITII